MNQTTKKQHYIWRNYLAPWTEDNSNTGQIICLRGKKVFPVSLLNIAHENYFYGVKELSKQERELIYEMTIRNTKGVQRTINEGWLNLYCATFDFADSVAFFGSSVLGYSDRSEIINNQFFKNWNIEYIEKLHGLIESTGMQYISMLQKNDLDFWKAESDRDKFSFFLSNQYFRTKNVRDGIVTVFERAKKENKNFMNIRPENMWIPLSLIYASNVGAYIAYNFSAVLLQAKGSCFIVGDQPVVNTYSTFDMMISPNDMELFYPITPCSALLLTKDRKYVSGQVIKITADEVQKYNLLEQRAAKELLFAKKRSHLDTFAPS